MFKKLYLTLALALSFSAYTGKTYALTLTKEDFFPLIQAAFENAKQNKAFVFETIRKTIAPSLMRATSLGLGGQFLLHGINGYFEYKKLQQQKQPHASLLKPITFTTIGTCLVLAALFFPGIFG